MLTFWVAVAEVERTASNSVWKCRTVTLTVNSAAPANPEDSANKDSFSLTDSLEIRLEMIRLINQTRKANGASELPVNEALMDAAQRAVDNWINSPSHFQTMTDPRCDCIGVGATQYNGITYCYMLVGIPNNVNFYA